MIYAYDNDNNMKITHILHAINDHTFTCQKCNEGLDPHTGESYAWGFYHQDNSKCHYQPGGCIKKVDNGRNPSCNSKDHCNIQGCEYKESRNP